MSRTFTLSAVCLLAACHVAPASRHSPVSPREPAPATSTDILPSCDRVSARQIVETRGTLLLPYKRGGGEWLPHAPVLVNEDFDFAIAAAIADIGPAVAAGRRLDNNRAKLRALGATHLSQKTQQAINGRRAAGMNVWFVLWGGEQAKLVLVADVFERDTERPMSHLEIEGLDRPFEHFSTEAVLDDEAQALLSRIEGLAESA